VSQFERRLPTLSGRSLGPSGLGSYCPETDLTMSRWVGVGSGHLRDQHRATGSIINIVVVTEPEPHGFLCVGPEADHH